MDSVDFKLIKPDKSLSDFVESFWLLYNPSDSAKEIVVLPDGRADLIFAQSATVPFHITLSGIETYPEQVMLPAKTLMFSISFKLPATEFIFHNPISNLLDYAEILPEDFWGFNANDLQDFGLFCKKASQKIQSILPKKIDNRKRKLFELIYVSNGEMSVKELSEKVFWSSRQINRYFNQQFGLSLKTYCNILRFRASLEHIAQGKLFPELNFTDQNHFIKEIKKFSGVVPKELSKNKNDRFVLLSVLKQK
jgi:AraC-like DNA-binding protein